MRLVSQHETVERVLYPLDQLRRELLLLARRSPTLAGILARRETRIIALLSLHACLSLVVAVLVPTWSLVLSPLLLGVPHLASDVRYLVLRISAPRSWALIGMVFAASMLSLRVLQPAAAVGGRWEHTLGCAWLVCAAIAGALFAGRCSARSLFALLAAGVLGALALAQPRGFALGLAHGHNLVGVALWALLYRGRARVAWAYCCVVALVAAGLTLGAGLGITLEYGVLQAFGLHLFAAADWLAPGVPDPYAIGLAMSFAFLQNVHYAIWLYGIPQRTLQREASLSFRMTYRMLLRDFGVVGLAIVAASMFLVGIGATLAPLVTRHMVLSLGSFHAWLELATCLFLWSATAHPSRLLR